MSYHNESNDKCIQFTQTLFQKLQKKNSNLAKFKPKVFTIKSALNFLGRDGYCTYKCQYVWSVFKKSIK